jgi:hypothetical protein
LGMDPLNVREHDILRPSGTGHGVCVEIELLF